jgi:hypothetical protein
MKKFTTIKTESEQVKPETPVIGENLVIIIPMIKGDGVYLKADNGLAEAFSKEVENEDVKKTAKTLLRSVGIDIDVELPAAVSYIPDTRATFRHYLYIIDCTSAKELIYQGEGKRVYIPIENLSQVKTQDGPTILGLNIINSLEK